MDYLLFTVCVLAFQIPSIFSVPTTVKPSPTDDTNISSSFSTSSQSAFTSPSAVVLSDISTMNDSQLLPTANSTSANDTETAPSTQESTLISSTISTPSSSSFSLTSATTSPTTAAATTTPVGKSDSNTSELPGTLSDTTKPGSDGNPMVVGNLLQSTNSSQDVTEVDSNTTETVTNDILENVTDVGKTTESTHGQTTGTQYTTTTTTTKTTTMALTTSNEDFNSNTSVSLSSSTESAVTSDAVLSSATNSANSSTSYFPTTSSKRTTSKIITTKKLPTSTHSSHDDESKQSPTPCNEKDQESDFGKYGLALSAIAFGICVLLFIVILVMMARASKQKRAERSSEDDKSTPKLKMLEIKDDATKRSTHDDLHVYSLDYEKHVQERIDEHKKKTRPTVAEKPTGGVSSFMLNKKPSMRSTSSSPSSPASLSPMSPAEQKPLLKQHDDEPVVFNFAKRPSELLTKRRESALDDISRRKSNASAGKSAKSEGPKDMFDDIDV